MAPIAHIDADSLGEARRLVQPRLDVAPAALPDLRQRNDRGRPACDVRLVAVENAQLPDSPDFSSGLSSACSLRLTGWSGWTVDIACL
jgi:hypothetical protein